jgi:hypothetical protein
MHDDVDGDVVHVLGAIVNRGRNSHFELPVDLVLLSIRNLRVTSS